MPQGVYDRSSVTRASEYERNRDPEYVAWRAERWRENCASRAIRKTPQDSGNCQEHQKNAMELAVHEAISETIERTRREIIAELKGQR